MSNPFCFAFAACPGKAQSQSADNYFSIAQNAVSVIHSFFLHRRARMI